MTDDIARQLKEAAAELQDAQQPELEELVSRVARRHQKRRFAGALVVLVGVVAAGSIVWSAVAPSSKVPRPQAAHAKVTTFEVPTNSWRPGRAGLDARAEGILRFTADGCPFLRVSTQYDVWLAFPAEAIGVESIDGMRYAASTDGYVYGQEGEPFDARGGSVPRSSVKGGCANQDGPIYGFGVMQRPSEKRLSLSD